jgi:hypothetical protein
MTLYIWFLLTIPHDRLVCELWTRNLPSQTALVQACGTDALDKYRLDVTRDGIGICSIPAASLLWVQDDCHLSSDLDAYRLRIIEPDHQELIGCSVATPTKDEPTANEIKRQCPDAKDYEVRFSGTRQATSDAGICKPPPVTQPASIATSETYYLLAGKMIWYGYAHAQCPGGLSGVDFSNFAATTCGMDGARSQMIDWQNSLDDAILQSAAAWNVPAKMLKDLIASETQFWTWTGVNDEHGLVQITDDGAAMVMHFYKPGYYQMSAKGQHEARQAWLTALDCLYCTPKQTIDHARATMDDYAQALAAYYCMTGSWDAALKTWNTKY